MILSLDIFRFKRNSSPIDCDDTSNYAASPVRPQSRLRKWIVRSQRKRGKLAYNGDDDDKPCTRPPTPTPYSALAPGFTIKRKPPPDSHPVNAEDVPSLSTLGEMHENLAPCTSVVGSQTTKSKRSEEGSATWNEVKSSFWEYYRQLEEKANAQLRLECILEEDEPLSEDECSAKSSEEMREPEDMAVSSTEPTEYAAPETRHSCEIDSNGINFSVHIAQELRQECTNFKRILEEIKPSEIDVVADLDEIEQNKATNIDPDTMENKKLIYLIENLNDEKAQLERSLLRTKRTIASQNSQFLLQECEKARLERELFHAEKSIDEQSTIATFLCDKSRLEQALLFAENQIEDQNAKIESQAYEIECLMQQISSLRIKLDLYAKQHYHDNPMSEPAFNVTNVDRNYYLSIQDTNSEYGSLRPQPVEYELLTPPTTPSQTVLNLLGSTDELKGYSDHTLPHRLENKRSCDLMRRKSIGTATLIGEMDWSAETGIGRMQTKRRTGCDVSKDTVLIILLIEAITISSELLMIKLFLNHPKTGP